MQQMPSPQGRAFPDTPQQPKAPLFASNATPGYEPQPRMQHTGSVPVIQAPKYATGQLRALHSTLPVQQMPPHSAYPANPLQAVQSYQARHAAPEQTQEPQQTAISGTPLMVRTVQGVAVAVTAEEMEKALAEHARKAGKYKGQKKHSEPAQTGKQKKEKKQKQEKTGKFAMKFSVTWCAFGVIGIVSAALWLIEWVIIPLLVYLNSLTGGAA